MLVYDWAGREPDSGCEASQLALGQGLESRDHLEPRLALAPRMRILGADALRIVDTAFLDLLERDDSLLW